MTMPMNDFDPADLGAKLPEGNQPEPDIVKLTDLDIGEMEIEDMQALWNSQSQEKLFAIDEATLHDYIRGKGQKVDLLLKIVEWLMIVVNLGVGVFLLYDSLRDKDPMLDYLLPIMYLGYFAFILYRRIERRQDEVQFAPTILGDLDKAIWRVDYLLRQGTSIILWYLVPLVLTLMVVTYLNSRLTWAIGLIVLTIPAAYFGSMWEARKFYLPKKRELEALREKLTASPQ